MRIRNWYQDVFLVGFLMSLLGPIIMFVSFVSHQKGMKEAAEPRNSVILGPGGTISGDVTVTTGQEEPNL